jgi:multiple sugar transport system substrate-binding protein
MDRSKVGRAVILLTAVVLWLAGTSAMAAEPTTITYWTFLDPRKDGPRERALAQVIQSFEEKNPDLRVRVEVLSMADLTTKLITSVAAGLGPDVTLVDPPSVKLARGKVLEPLDRYLQTLDPTMRNDFYHPETRVYEGKTYSVQLSGNASALFYRKDLFEKAGLKPPRTVDELVKAGMAVKTDQVWGFAEGVGRPYSQVHRVLFPLIWAAGGDVVTKDGKAAFNGPEGVRTVQFFVDMAKVQKIMPPDVAGLSYEERVQAFMAGRYAMVVEGMHRYREIDNAPNVHGQVGVTYIPSWGGVKPAPTPSIGWDIGIPASAKHKDAAWRFIAHCLSEESQITSVRIAGAVPSRPSLVRNPFFATPEGALAKFTIDYLALSSRELPPVPNFSDLLNVMLVAINEILVSNVPTQTALDKAAAEYDKLVSR